MTRYPLFRVEDDNIYLTARLLKLEMSESNDTKEAELGDYVRQESGIDEKVIELAERFEKIAKNRNFYTWTALQMSENGTGISANAYGKDYLESLRTGLRKKLIFRSDAVHMGKDKR